MRPVHQSGVSHRDRLSGGDSLTIKRENRLFGVTWTAQECNHCAAHTPRWLMTVVTTEGSGRTKWDHGARWGPSSDSSRTRGVVTSSATNTTKPTVTATTTNQLTGTPQTTEVRTTTVDTNRRIPPPVRSPAGTATSR